MPSSPPSSDPAPAPAAWVRPRERCGSHWRTQRRLWRRSRKRSDRRHDSNEMVTKGTTSFPEWVVPMAATLTQERFTGPEWVFERKLDGIRMLAFKNGSDVKLYSRNRLLQHYPAVVEAISRLPVREVILDCGVDWGSGVSIGYLLVYIS